MLRMKRGILRSLHFLLNIVKSHYFSIFKLLSFKFRFNSEKYYYDALHIAIATKYKLDAIVSWNLTHIVKFSTIYRLKNLNTKLKEKDMNYMYSRGNGLLREEKSLEEIPEIRKRLYKMNEKVKKALLDQIKEKYKDLF